MKINNGIKLRTTYANLAVYTFFLAIFKPYFLPTVLQQVIKCVLILLVYIFLVSKAKTKFLINASIPFCLCAVVSSVYNYYQGNISLMDGPVNGVLYALCLYGGYTLICYCATTGQSAVLCSCLFKITLLFCIVNVITLIHPLKLDEFGMKIYAFGSKFMVCYFFILLTGLFAALNYHKIQKRMRWKILYLTLIMLDIVCGIITDCSTGIVASFIFITILFLPSKVLQLLLKPKIICLLIIGSVIIPFVFLQLTRLSIVQYIIVNLLGRNLNLTRRTVLYDNYLLPVLAKRIWIGYGYGNRAIFTYSGSYGNAQNGLLEHFVNYGLVGVVALLYMVYNAFKKSSMSNRAIGLSLIVLAMIIAGLVEISYNWFFFLGLALVRWVDTKSMQEGVSSGPLDRK